MSRRTRESANRIRQNSRHPSAALILTFVGGVVVGVVCALVFGGEPDPARASRQEEEALVMEGFRVGAYVFAAGLDAVKESGGLSAEGVVVVKTIADSLNGVYVREHPYPGAEARATYRDDRLAPILKRLDLNPDVDTEAMKVRIEKMREILRTLEGK